MKAVLLLVAARGLSVPALTAKSQPAPATDAVVQVDFSNPGLSPPQWTLTIRPDGSGHFRSQMGKTQSVGEGEIETPGVDRDIHLSPQFAGRVFKVAQRHGWFNQPCES